MKIYIAADHAGYILKEQVINHLISQCYIVQNLGTDTSDSVDYPVFAKNLSKKVAAEPNTLGILICGTGIGMSIAANKIRGIRAALCCDVFSASATRAHNDANVLCMGARVISTELAIEIVNAFLKSNFEGGRHIKRVKMLENE